MKELVSRDANLDILNADGFRPLHLACGLRNDNRGNEQVNADSFTCVRVTAMT